MMDYLPSFLPNPSSSVVFDSFRHRFLSEPPEERVRKQLVLFLVESLCYPPHVILIEKSLKHFLSVTCGSRLLHTKRRLDLLIVSPTLYTDVHGNQHNIGSPVPLLLIECKARKINDRTKNQVLCYNQMIQAPCVSIVSAQKQQTGFHHPKTHTFSFYPGIPNFHQLLAYYLWMQSNTTRA